MQREIRQSRNEPEPMMNPEDYQTINYEPGTVATVTMDRPEVRNAFNDRMIAELEDAAKRIDTDDGVRVAVLTGGDGKVFSAGADLNWMKSMVDYTWEENLEDSEALAVMLDSIWKNSKPFIARVNGHAIGGGAGLVAACDIAVADERAKLGFTEVKLGLLPAVVSPYAMRKMGFSNSRRYFLTGEVFPAEEARRIGLVHELGADTEEVDELVEGFARKLTTSGPEALADAKELVRTGWNMGGQQVLRYTVSKISEARVSDEGQEGMNAYLDDRNPEWVEELPDELKNED